MLDRRNILKFLLAGAAGSLLTPLPWKLLDDSAVWTQNWPWLGQGRPGRVSFARTSSKLCASASGMRVQLVDGRPIRLLPDPEHPLSLGGISALALAEAQLLYSPARVRAPLLRGADGALRPVSEAAALDFFLNALRKAKRRPDNVLCLCGDETGSISEVLSLLTRALNSEAFYFMPSELQPAARAAHTAGIDALPAYRLEDSDFILCLGADILESWGTVMRNNHIVALGRARLVCCGPARTATAMVADKWLPVRPGTESLLLLGLANLLVKGDFPPPIMDYAPEMVCAATGLSTQPLRELAQALSRARRPLIITGSSVGQGGSLVLTRLGFALNRLLPGQALSFRPGLDPVLAGAAKSTDLARNDLYARTDQGGEASAPELLLCYDANPWYALPAQARARLNLDGIPCKITFSSFLDETALAADLVLPLPLGLERLDDVYTPFGAGDIVYSLCPQIITPIHTVRPPAEILFTALADLGAPPHDADGSAIRSLEDLLKARAAQLGADWRILSRGEAFTAAPHAGFAENQPGERLADLARNLDRYSQVVPPPDKLAAALPPEALFLAPLPRLALGTAVSGIPSYTPGLISQRELQGLELFVQVNARTARRLGLVDGQRARLCARCGATSAAAVSLSVRLTIFEGIMDNVVGLPLGYGHTAFDEFSRGKGVNGLDLYSLVPEGPARPDEPAESGQTWGGQYHLAVTGLELKGI